HWRAPVRPCVVPPAPTGVEVGGDPGCFTSYRTGLIFREATLSYTGVEQVVVLQHPAGAVGAPWQPDVELEILRVVAVGRAPERLLEVEVPAVEVPLRPVPEEPDRIRV